MKLSPLQLEGYFLKEVSFKVNEEISEKPTELKKSDNLDIEVAVLVTPTDEERLHWRCELTLELKPKENADSVYNLFIVLVGFFFISGKYPKEGIELLAKTNCPALLYSTAREMVVTVVRRSPFTPVLIPSVTFLEMGEKRDEKETERPAKAKPPRLKKVSKNISK